MDIYKLVFLLTIIPCFFARKQNNCNFYLTDQLLKKIDSVEMLSKGQVLPLQLLV